MYGCDDVVIVVAESDNFCVDIPSVVTGQIIGWKVTSTVQAHVDHTAACTDVRAVQARLVAPFVGKEQPALLASVGALAMLCPCRKYCS